MVFVHKSVLLKESISGLSPREDGVYIDATAGGGGHSSEILKHLKSGILISLDQDPDAICALKQRFKGIKNSIVKESNFSDVRKVMQSLNIAKVDGILFDLGVSSHQLDTPERGFSYHSEALLDMRMSQSGISAEDVVNDFSEAELSKIIYDFGEEKFSKRIAGAIAQKRKEERIKTTTHLAEIIKEAIPISSRRKSTHHPARKTFQAIRIFVNDELGNLERGLDESFSLLKSGGRIVVITFHSLEDRIVKKKMIEWCKGCECPPDFPVCVCGKVPRAKLVNRKPILPSEEELKGNNRSRSAKLRVCEKI